MRKYFIAFVLVIALTMPGYAIAGSSAHATGIAAADAGAFSGGNAFTSNSVNILENTPFFPMVLPMIQGGKVGDITDQLPNIGGMKKLVVPYVRENGERKIVDAGETINPDKVTTYNGWFMDRICLEDLIPDIVKYYRKAQNSGWDPAKMRYRVYYKDKAKSNGAQIGGAGGASGVAGNGVSGQGSAGLTLGYASSWADPMYVIMVCEIL